MATDKINLLRRVSSVDVAPEFAAYSKVVIHTDDENAIEVGDDTGRCLEITNPFGTQTMAQQMLASLRGYQYQPFYATGALLDPAAEIGDGVSVKGIYGGIYQRTRTFNQLMAADIAAPHEEEINHEYQFVSPAERKYQRQIGDVKATILVQAGQIQLAVQKADEAMSKITQTTTDIDAKVTADMSGTRKTFGWKLTATAWELYANNNTVFKATKDGVEVTGSGTFTGKVIASSGKIGGFTIGKTAIYNNISKYGGSQKTGVYLGTDGIQLGQRFKVDTSGNLTVNNMTANNMTANSATLSGTLTIDGKQITSSSLYTGASQSSTNYQTWSTGSTYGYNYHDATKSNTDKYPAQFTCGRLLASRMSLSGNDLGISELTYLDGNGNAHTKNFVIAQ